jgi:hypothetical protein
MPPSTPVPIRPTTMERRIQVPSAAHEGCLSSGSSNQSVTSARRVQLWGERVAYGSATTVG